MAIWGLPDQAATSFSAEIIGADRVYVSDSGARQVQTNSGSRWRFTLTWENINGDDYLTLRQRWALIGGQRNTVRVKMATHTNWTRSGSGANTPVILGAHAVGATTIDVDNLTLSTNLLWKGGDWISVGEQLYMLGGNYNSDSNGEKADIPIWPPLHIALSGGEAVEQDDPQGVFFIVEARGLDWVKSSVQMAPAVTLVLEQDVTAV